MGIVLLALVGCDNTPNPNFEQSLKDRQAERLGDPYSMLSHSLPEESYYFHMEKGARSAYALQAGLSALGTYESLLRKLDAEPPNSTTSSLITDCRPAFTEVSAFLKDKGVDAKTAKARATVIADRLRTCREKAIAVQEGAAEAAGNIATALRRFSSTGMVLAGVAAAGFGDEAAGLEIWRAGEELVAKDMPGFEVKPYMFIRGYN